MDSPGDKEYTLGFAFPFFIAALVLLAADDLAQALIVLQGNTFFLDLLLALLLGIFAFGLGAFRGGLEDLRLHGEELIQRNAILGELVLVLFGRLDLAALGLGLFEGFDHGLGHQLGRGGLRSS